MNSQHQGEAAGQPNAWRRAVVAILTYRDPGLATAGCLAVALACIAMAILGSGLILRLGCAVAAAVEIAWVVQDLRGYLRGGQA